MMNKIIPPEKYKVTFFAALISGLFSHMFALVNVMHNYDSINASFHGFGNGVESGRWSLTFISMVMHKFFGGYNLPWFNGVVTLILLSISAVFIVSSFDIRKHSSAMLIGVLFVVFPTVSSILFFRFVSMYDAFAILLAIVAAWILNRSKYGALISAVCTAISMGIYQAYFPITVTMLIVVLIRATLRQFSAEVVIKKGLYYLFCLVLGLAMYFIMQKLSLICFGVDLLNYQGISKMGAVNIRELPAIIFKAYKSFLTFFLNNYCSLTPNILSKCAALCLWVLSIITTGLILIAKKGKVGQWLMVACLYLIFPISVNLIEVMAPESHVYTMMVYSFVFVYITPVVLAEELCSIPIVVLKRGINKFGAQVVTATFLILSAVSINYIYLDNVNYTSMYYATKQTENYMNALVTQVRMTEGYRSSQEWVFIGESFEDPLLVSEWGDVPKYGGNDTFYINAYSRIRWINTYFGYNIPLAEEKTINKLKEKSVVKDMPCFPDEGSICVVENHVVIKLSEGLSN